MAWWLVALTGWLIFFVWLAALLPSAVSLLARTLDRRTAKLSGPEIWPLVSVIVPARDEKESIEESLCSHLATDYPRIEIIAVDDRSQDGTGEIMDRLSAADPRLHVVHISDVPEGWLGKNHALHVGAQRADGEYLLFTDGDVFFKPDTIRRAIAYAAHYRVDHLCFVPSMIPAGYWENSLVACFGLAFSVGVQPWLVPTSFKLVYVGVGAFNLVRADAYRQAGGHVPIRMDVVDDIKLGKLMKRSGFRQDILLPGDRVRVRWQNSAWDVIRGLEKNAFASQNYSLVAMGFLTLAFGLLLFLPYVAVPMLHDERCLGYAATLALLHVAYAVAGKLFGSGWSVWPAFPVAALGMLLAFWRSAIITLRQGGVRWRGTFYPLSELRQQLYR